MKHLIVVLTLISTLGVSSCALFDKAQVTPATGAHYGADLVENAAKIQRVVTMGTRSGAIPVDVARKIRGALGEVYTESGRLEEMLVAFDGALTIDLKKALAGDVDDAVTKINGWLVSVAVQPLSGAEGAEIAALVKSGNEILVKVKALVGRF